MGFFKNLFGGKPSVEEKTVKYCEDIDLSYNTQKYAKAEKLEAERDSWYASLSEDDKKKSDAARDQWKKEQSEMIEKTLREAMGSALSDWNEKMSEMLDDEEDED